MVSPVLNGTLEFFTATGVWPSAADTAADLERHKPVLEQVAGARLTVLEGGYRVKEAVSGTHWIDLLFMLYDWRIVTTLKSPVIQDSGWDRGWCYAGAGLRGFIPAALAAIAWDGADDTEPAGYIKRAHSHR